MRIESIKLELIEWLSRLEDNDTIEYLKLVKDTRSQNKDWWNELSPEVEKGIERGLKDIDQGRTISHEEVKNKYGL